MLCSHGAHAAVATTAGNNLTAYNPNGGVISNNTWNTMTNGRYEPTNAKADFGNCNAVIMRCASPKCASGGCTTIEIATPIVAGCVKSNASCKQYGDDLTQYIVAQLVASSTAKANEQAAAMAAAANAAATDQANKQMQQMQMQMQQLQTEIQQQNAETVAQLQNALEEQKQLTAQAIEEANAAKATPEQVPTTEGITTAQAIAAQSGVDPNIIFREQATGEILTSIENAEAQLKKLKATMEDAFEYAGCDTRGDNCTGPKRVKMFKQRATDFFDPYETILEEMLDAITMAASLGVDISDIYMFLDNSCSRWAQYLCQYSIADLVPDPNDPTGQKKIAPTKVYNLLNCPNGKSVPNVSVTNYVRGGKECTIGGVVPPEDDPACQVTRVLSDLEEVRLQFLASEAGEQNSIVRVGCLDKSLTSARAFNGVYRKRQAQIDIDVLRRIISQDAPTTFGTTSLRTQITPAQAANMYCAITDEAQLSELELAVTQRKLPAQVCTQQNMTLLTNTPPASGLGSITAPTFQFQLTPTQKTSSPSFNMPNWLNNTPTIGQFTCEYICKGMYVNNDCLCGSDQNCSVCVSVEKSKSLSGQ